jgi:hypothetical protein
MSLVTLANGQQVNLTSSNVDELARLQLGIYRARGIVVDEAATLQAFFQAAGRDTAYAAAGTPGGVLDLNKLPAVAAANSVASNLFVKASDLALDLVPESVGKIWTDTSNGIVTAADRSKAAAVAAADQARGFADTLRRYLPGALQQLNTTAQLAIVGGTIVAVVGGAVYLTYVFKR